MRLLIDAGNTNIKLAWLDGDNWLSTASYPVGQTPDMTDGVNVQQVYVSNVAGPDVAQRLRDACVARNWPVQFITAQTEQCGVKNGYALPVQLGSDRWAALIAAWHLAGRACLVVNSGTATTIDALSGSGEFIGGLILPGIALMQRSLVAGTAGLQSGCGEYANFPCNTADAMLSGAIQASCGAIQRQHALLNVADAPVLLSGGAACLLLPHLGLPVQRVDNLVLQGLLLIAQGTE
ncbi:MAG: type III pantothenate kinase [Proteobacteria bacterium]|nr:type III pantothenate kinase [Pseudomonadota bacterium]